MPGYKVREEGAFDPHVYTHLKSCCSSRYMYDKVTSRERNDKLAIRQNLLGLFSRRQVFLNIYKFQ